MSRRSLSVLVLVFVAGAFIVWRCRHEPARPTPATTAKPATTRSVLPDTEPTRIMTLGDTLPQLSEDFMSLTPEQARATGVERAKQALALYEETLRYPLFSRPADGSNQHILDWNVLTPIGQPFAKDDRDRDIETYLSLDAMYAGPGQPLVATLEVFRADGDTRVPVPSQPPTGRIEMYSEEQEAWLVAEHLVFRRDAGVWVTTFTPSTIAALAATQGETRVVARVELGEFYKELALPFRYAASKVFEVVALAGDRISDGSLEVTLDVDVKYVAPVLIQAGLYDERGEKPIVVYDEWFRPERTGRQLVTLVMFGKAIRESGVHGPYRVMRLHGHVRVPDLEPPEVFWSHPDQPGLWTKPYRASDFSEADYSSPEKDAKIQQYKDFIANPP